MPASPACTGNTARGSFSSAALHTPATCRLTGAGLAQGPRCSIRSKNMYSDLSVDYLKLTLLNLPAVLLVRYTSLRWHLKCAAAILLCPLT